MQAVASEVHHRAAGQGQGPPWVVGTRIGHRDNGVDPDQVAQLVRGQQFVQRSHDGVVDVVEPVGHHHARAAGGVADFGGLVGVDREGFLRQHMLAGLDGAQVPRGVQRVGQWVVDGFDFGVGKQIGVGGRDSLHPVFGGERLGPLSASGRDRHEAGTSQVCRLDDGQLGDAGSSEDAYSQGTPRRCLDGRRFFRVDLRSRTAACGHGMPPSVKRRYSALVHTSATGPSPLGSSVRMVSCSRVYQPS